ncbi:MAG: hypothetical protein IT536_13825 [Hyphomicrobiales bacterium]|nr:hypothetical protein [Hyphomicrobiales bacterium]
MPAFEPMAQGYRNLWRSMRVTQSAECEQAARRILAARERYRAIERKTGVPWFFVGLLHMRESANNFAGILHNGEKIIGTGRKTRLVPAGRGPFASWEQAAVDALTLKGLHRIATWDVARLGYEFERFNGFGYIGRGVNSPYVWAGSNHYIRGKYVADGVFSPGHVDVQLGCMPVLAVLCKLDGEVDRSVNGTRSRARDIALTTGGGAATGTIVAVGVQQGWGWIEATIAAVVAALIVAAAVVFIRRRRAPQVAPRINDDASMPDRGGAAQEPIVNAIINDREIP